MNVVAPLGLVKPSKDKKRLPGEDSANEKQASPGAQWIHLDDLIPQQDAPGAGRDFFGGRDSNSKKRNLKITAHMPIEKKTKPAAKAKAQVKVKDLKPRKDAKGGFKASLGGDSY